MTTSRIEARTSRSKALAAVYAELERRARRPKNLATEGPDDEAAIGGLVALTESAFGHHDKRPAPAGVHEAFRTSPIPSSTTETASAAEVDATALARRLAEMSDDELRTVGGAALVDATTPSRNR